MTDRSLPPSSSMKAWVAWVDQQIKALQRGDWFKGRVSVGGLQVGNILIDDLRDVESPAPVAVRFMDKATGVECILPLPCTPDEPGSCETSIIPPMSAGLVVGNSNITGRLSVPNNTEWVVPYDITLWTTEPLATITELIIGPDVATFLPAFRAAGYPCGGSSPGWGVEHCDAGVRFGGFTGGTGYIRLSLHILSEGNYDKIVASQVIEVPSSQPLAMQVSATAMQTFNLAGWYVSVFQTTGSTINIAVDNQSFIAASMIVPGLVQVNGYF